MIARRQSRKLGKPLRGDKGEFWSYRVGDYRIVSLIEDKGWSLWSSQSAIDAISTGDTGQQACCKNLLSGWRS